MWKYETYFKKGISHTKSSTVCQDSVLIKENDKSIVAALADGLGSLKHSDIAAQTVTNTICNLFLNNHFKKEFFESGKNDIGFKKEFVRIIKDKLASKAKETQTSLSDMDCTLVFVYISKIYKRAIVGRLGDSAICVIKRANSISINDSDVSANGTNAILDSNSNEKLELYRFNLISDDVCGFILTSDGLDNELYMKGSNHVNKAAEKYFNAVSVSANPKSIIVAAIDELTKDENTPFDDDISIAVLSCVDEPLVFPSDPTWLCSCGSRNRLQDTYCIKCHQDFSRLYKNVKFVDYGGKAAFFSKINGTPDEERDLVGAPSQIPVINSMKFTKPETNKDEVRSNEQNGKVPSNTVTANNTSQNAPPVKSSAPNAKGGSIIQDGKYNSKIESRNKDMEKNKQHRSRMNLQPMVIALIIFVIGIIIGSLFSKLFISKDIKELSDKIDSLAKVLNQQYLNSVSSEYNTTSNDFVVLQNGDFFWGETDEGVPNGDGVLLNNGKYYIGNFINGSKNGDFYIVEKGNIKNVTIVSYENDKEIDVVSSIGSDTTTQNSTQKKATIIALTYLKEKPNATSDIIRSLVANEEVTVLTDADATYNSEEWIKVVTSDNKTGWVDAKMLNYTN